MGKKFEEAFSSPCQFYPSGYHISRTNLSAEEAAEIFNGEELEYEDVKPEQLKESWVRFQFCDETLRDEIGQNCCWMIVPEGTKNAQPTWEAYGE